MVQLAVDKMVMEMQEWWIPVIYLRPFGSSAIHNRFHTRRIERNEDKSPNCHQSVCQVFLHPIVVFVQIFPSAQLEFCPKEQHQLRFSLFSCFHFEQSDVVPVQVK